MSHPVSVVPPRLTLVLDATPLPISSLFDALARVRVFTREHGLTPNDYGDACGRIRRDGVPFCRVSHHGRLWALDEQRHKTYREMNLLGEVAP